MPRPTAVPYLLLLLVLGPALSALALTAKEVLSSSALVFNPSVRALSTGSSSSAVPHWVPTQHQQRLQQLHQQRITPLPVDRPHVIAHRGASGLLPEHTLAAYKMAVAQGADFVECDIVVTRDLQLVCRHEPNLNSTTNAAEVFPDRVATYEIDGESVTGIFASDLTLAEVKQLWTKQRWEFRDHSHDGLYQIATLDEFLDYADSASRSAGRAVGIYPELKHPTWHNKLPQIVAANTTIEDLVVQKLHARGYGASAPFGSDAWRSKPVLVQCFEATSLQKLAGMTSMPLVLLLGGWPGYVSPDQGLKHEEMIADDYLAQISKFVSGIGPWKSSLYTVVEEESSSKAESATADGDSSNISSTSSACRSGRCSGFIHPDVGRVSGSSGVSSRLQSTGLVAKLHKHGFKVHPYTLRDEQQFLPSSCGDVLCEFNWLFNNEGVDGAFADYPGTLADWLQQQQQLE